ncbi:hypothetical protein AYO20_08574 [Fonsecaea nubica]|uniref:Protein HRI1 n=1 Tax=Fonsecaea nubica TaxID=856822 RepID=A0A178CPR5_9EURO|nr:hypothetical protein AYO20_08574 [Fonsecaea nubica]OAL30881.1 hypothetical protein AYO20_08574 [Fonsecaea nubica]
MSPRLSTRLSIRWVPGEASEPTDTLIIGVGGWYVDLRITKLDGSTDWAMAGERLILSQEPLTCKWTHWIDSRGYTEPDVGSFKPASQSTDSIETGSMLHPETNIMTPYEEVWRTLPATFTYRFPSAWILRSVDGKTFLGQLGGDFLALKGGNEGPAGMTGFCARREAWDDTKGAWITKYETGDEQNLQYLPRLAQETQNRAGKEMEWVEGSKEGDTVDIFGAQYIMQQWNSQPRESRSERSYGRILALIPKVAQHPSLPPDSITHAFARATSGDGKKNHSSASYIRRDFAGLPVLRRAEEQSGVMGVVSITAKATINTLYSKMTSHASPGCDGYTPLARMN